MCLRRQITNPRYRKCALCIIRYYNAEANANRPLPNNLVNQLKRMSVNQWRAVAQLKDQFSDKNRIMHVIKKEWVDILKKLPAINAQLTTSQSQEIVKKTDVDTSKMTTALFESMQVLNDIKSKFSQQAPTVSQKTLIEAKWKTRTKTISSESVISRTKYLISALQCAETDESVLKRLSDFTNHVLEYHGAASLAVKYGAVRTILRIRKDSKVKEVVEASREALAIIGYVDPPAGRGIRILAIDGGGVRGLLVIEMLRRLEELTNKKVHELFDYICGVSTGSIIACTVGASGKSLEEISQLYKILSTKVFTQNAFEGARSLFWNHGYYDTAVWEKILQDHVGDQTFYQTARKTWCPKIGAVSTVVHEGQVVPFVFRNYELPYRVRSQYTGSHKYRLWEATRASAAAPAIFGEFKLGPFLHQDGGMLVNNPAAVALHEAKLLWPKKSIQCVVSCGTGRVNPALVLNRDEPDLNKQASWKEKFSQILVSATDTEAVHTVLSDLLPSTRYFRFNPYLTEMLSMVEFQPEKLELMEQDAAMYIRRNDEQFAEAATNLSQSKPIVEKARDWLNLQSTLYQPFQ